MITSLVRAGIDWARSRYAVESGLRQVARPLLDAAEIAALASEAYAAVDQGLHRPDVQYRHAGDMRSIYLGQGLDFEESRLYQRGDDLRSMDWRTTARTGKAYVKVFREEHQAALHIVVDRGASMRFATRTRLKATQAARLAVLAAFAAVRKGANVGGSIVAPERIVIPPASGQAGALRLIEAVVASAPPLADAHGDSGLWATLEMLESVLARGTKLVVISDFYGFSPGSSDILTRLAYHNEVVPVLIADPSELVLPDLGTAFFRASTDGEVATVNTSDANLRRHYAERQQSAQQALRDFFSALGIQLQVCLTTAERLPYL